MKEKWSILLILSGILAWFLSQTQPIQAQTEPTTTALAIPKPTNTLTPTATPTMTAVPTETLTPLPPATATMTPGDAYEPDDPPGSAVYMGAQLRSFYPEGDIDYVRARLKGGLITYISTHNLTGAADTELYVYRDDDGYLDGFDPLLAYDDDSGVGLGSAVSVAAAADIDATIVIINKSLAYGPDVGYVLHLIDSASATATATATYQPTFTPYPTLTPAPTYTPYPSPTRVEPTWTPYPTAVPYPTYTPYPSPLPPATAVARPPMSGGGPAPARTPTPAPFTVLVFIDSNDNGWLDAGEGAEGVLVILSDVAHTWEQEATTTGGRASFNQVPTGELVATVPYLHQQGRFVAGETAEILLPAAEMPVYLP